MNLLSYIQGRRKGKEANRIEREAMQDPFLAEAIEGYDSISGDHVEAIRRMQQQVNDRSHSERRNILLWTSIAASIAIIIGVGWYLLVQDTAQAPVVSEVTQTPLPGDTLRQTETIAMTEQKKRETIRQEEREQQKVISPSPPIETEMMVVADHDIQQEEAADHIVVEDAEVAAESIAPKLEVQHNEPVAKEISPSKPATAGALQGRVAGVQVRGVATKQQQHLRRVHGQVVDESGDPLPGVNVVVKDRTTGVVTNASGEFSLDLDDSATIVASFIGYESTEMKADTTQLLIAMHEDTRQLDEVVVTAYGTKRKNNVTGAISTEKKERETVTSRPTIGKRAYRKYLEENIVRPVDGECAGVKGKVTVQFNIDAKGRPCNLKVTRKLCDAADREAMRLISEGCDWTQGNSEVSVVVEF